MAPPIYWAAHAVAGGLNEAWLTAYVAKTDFHRYFHRSMMIAALVLLWPLLRALRIENFGYALGLRRDRRGWQRLAAGFAVAFGMLAVLVAIFVLTGIYRMRGHVEYSKFGKVLLSTLAVPVLEEFLFRGALQGVMRKTTVDSFAMVAVAILFAAVHFLSPNGTDPPVIQWWSGLALLPDTLSQFSQPSMLLGGFTTMLLVGLILGYARVRTQSLWMPIGLHAGWVLGKMGLPLVARPSVAWPWVGPDILVGVGPLVTVLGTWAIVWWLLRDTR